MTTVATHYRHLKTGQIITVHEYQTKHAAAAHDWEPHDLSRDFDSVFGDKPAPKADPVPVKAEMPHGAAIDGKTVEADGSTWTVHYDGHDQGVDLYTLKCGSMGLTFQITSGTDHLQKLAHMASMKIAALKEKYGEAMTEDAMAVGAEEPKTVPGSAYASNIDADFDAVFGDKVAQPQAATPAPQAAGTNPIKALKKGSTDVLKYGEKEVIFKMAGLEPSLQIKNLSPTQAQELGELVGASKIKWMPIKKAHQIILGGMPKASGAATAEKVHGYMKGAFGAPVVAGQQGAAVAMPAGAKVEYKDLQVGMKFYNPSHGDGAIWEVTGKAGANLKFTKTEGSGFGNNEVVVPKDTYDQTYKPYIALKEPFGAVSVVPGNAWKNTQAMWQAMNESAIQEGLDGVNIGKGHTGVGNSKKPTLRVYTAPGGPLGKALVATGYLSKNSYVYTDKVNSATFQDLHEIAAKHGIAGVKTTPTKAAMAGAAAPQAIGLKVGDTKVENGKTYILNANHKWELLEPGSGSMGAAVPLMSGDMSNWKQVGPQKGSNPGGLFEDLAGKKWYVKFPESEDIAKNEVLAGKLYSLLGIEVPKVKLVKKGGKVGIASQFIEGLTSKKGEELAKTPGAMEGFGADAWLANWDVVGLGFDNLLTTKDGKALRVDVGGALVYRAQGGKKGDAFGNTVPEVDSLRNAATNANTASVFGGMDKRALNHSIAKVLEMPDDVIAQAVEKFGPGTAAEKKALAEKLIQRKAYLAKKFPEAEAIAHPPKPDPRNLPVDKAKIPTPPNFMNWNGQGKGLSSNAKVNEVNQAAGDAVHASALQGNLVALKDVKVVIVDKATGATETVKLADNLDNQKISQHVKHYWTDLVAYMEVVANPGSEKLKSYALTDADDLGELAESFPAKPFGKNTENIDPHEVLGYFMTLGQVSNPQDFEPKKKGINVTQADTNEAFVKYKKWPPTLVKYIDKVQDSGGINHHFKGKDTTYGGVNIKQALAEAYEFAATKPEGTRIWRWMNIPESMKKQLTHVQPGLVFQNTDSMCCSKAAHWGNSTHFGSDLLLEIHYAKGAKAVDSFGSGRFGGEEEITTLPGQRFMILSKGTAPNGKIKLELLMLPPDPTFVPSATGAKVA